MSIEKNSDAYFEKLGTPKPGKPFDKVDDYRFMLAHSYLLPGSVLDVGAFYGDFLQRLLAEDPNRTVFGTDINEARIILCNKNLGKSVVRVDFKNGSLGTFSDQSVDTVVATEVLEHIPDHQFALSELCRVAKKRVIVTVPNNEKIRQLLCLHCNEYTPYSGHLHSYKAHHTFTEILPAGYHIAAEFPFGNVLLKFMPAFACRRITDRLLGILFPQKNRWLFVVLERTTSSVPSPRQ